MTIRRTELGIPRNRFRWRYRLEQIEGTSKLPRALHLARMEGSEEFLTPLGLALADVEDLAEGRASLEEVLERARSRRPAG
ncbi:MAG: hypothetical protein AAF725_18670 [Acidobacteriota bacterium]